MQEKMAALENELKAKDKEVAKPEPPVAVIANDGEEKLKELEQKLLEKQKRIEGLEQEGKKLAEQMAIRDEVIKEAALNLTANYDKLKTRKGSADEGILEAVEDLGKIIKLLEMDCSKIAGYTASKELVQSVIKEYEEKLNRSTMGTKQFEQ